MLKAKRSKIINAGSYVESGGEQVQVASMYASIDDEGNRTENCTIIQQELYSQFHDEVESDIAQFRQMAAALAE